VFPVVEPTDVSAMQPGSTGFVAQLFQFGIEVRGVHPAGNTRFDFERSAPADLDKVSIRNHAEPVSGRLGCITLGTARRGRGDVMRLITGLLAAVMLLAGIASSQAVVRIADDRGGRIGTYVDKYQSLRSSGETVMIDGLCASACTIVLGAVPHEKICVTSRANLGFHAAWDMGANGRAVTNAEATHMLYTMYPTNIRRWIAQRGGLTRHMIFLRGRQLMSMYRPCYMDAQASTAR
jgi:hypothetical protein